MKTALLALACLVTLAGCASGPVSNPRGQARLPAAPELSGVPFFPQKQFQCGPAALATVLGASGMPVTADELAPEVYIPGRRGSLQTELLGAARRHGRIPYPVGPTTGQLASHLRDRRPVLVLQNLGFRRFPIWHYAVVIGFEPEQDRVILRSGTHRRHLMSRKRFLASWDRADRWGIVLLAPGEMPLDASERKYLRAVSGLEAAGQYELARTGYEAALMAWPGSQTALLGIAYSAYRMGDHHDAEHALRDLLDRNPAHAIAWNNLAGVLQQRGCFREAMRAIDTGLQLAPEHLQPEFHATRLEMSREHPGNKPAGDCEPVPATH